MKPSLTVSFFLILFVVISGGAFFARRKLKDKTFILYYHKINNFKKGGLKSLFVRPVYFDLQMRYLKWRGYKTIALQELARLLKSGEALPPKVFVITFDDGYKDNYINGYPVLKKYGFCATVFITVDNIGKKSSYPGEPPEEHLSLEDIRNSADIFDFGSHTLTHPDLSALDNEAELKAEISVSRQKLSATVGVPGGKKVDTFCYPFGRYSESAVRLVRENYSAACTTGSGLVSKGDDPYLLKRVEFKDLFTMSFRDFFKVWEFYLKIALGV